MAEAEMDETAPPVPATLAERMSAWRARFGSLAWLYALVPVPLLTDWLENGVLRESPRAWITEAVGGLTIAALVTKVVRNQRALEALARRDSLTGMLNRRSFLDALETECARARRSGGPLCVVYLDVDNFKAVNDRFGHAAGDQVLKQVALAIGTTIRARLDGGFRLGGDEFTVLLPSSTAAQAEAVVDRIRGALAEGDPAWSSGGVGISAGIVEFDAAETPQALIQRGDAAMYRQKAARRLAAPALQRPAAADFRPES